MGYMAKISKAITHDASNAIPNPQRRAPMFCRLTPTTVEVNPYINLQSYCNLLLKLLGLFFFLSKKLMGIANIFLYINYLTFKVNCSPVYANKKF